ncbi:MAG TPA: FAD-binding oxidoreductase [Candidatus Limiplasma sp.]|nr:FAD-binding oxidoreductase [Candidatus Limiplasma sp.]
MASIKKELVGIVGEQNVIDSPEVLESYSKDQSFATPMMPVMVVKPENAAQVQELVKWANQTKTPLVPVSSAAPHFKGDTVPSVPEAVIVDLSGMNKILSINRQQRMAIVEPGVTYEQLLPALAKEGMTLSVPLTPKANKSVVTSVLEIEPRLNVLHQFNYTEPIRCTEVTYGDGNQIYTGEAGNAPKDLKKQWDLAKWQVHPNGPQMTDMLRMVLQAQGSMGIVTWASLKCELLPTIKKMFLAPAKKSTDLEAFVYKVIWSRFGDKIFMMNRAYLATLLGETREKIAGLKAELPNWVAAVGVSGDIMLPEMKVEGQSKDLEDIAQLTGVPLATSVPGVVGADLNEKVLNPSGATYWKQTAKGAFQDIFFITTLDKTSKFISLMYELAVEAGYPSEDIGVYIQPQHMGTSVHLEFNLPYDAANAVEVKRVKALYEMASREMSKLGAYYARPYGIWCNIQLNKDAQSYVLLQRMKNIFDPNNIMNTGKLTLH